MQTQSIRPQTLLLTTIMVEIHLHDNGSYIPFLSIPPSDVRRLSLRPLKWIRFVMFSICGARGHLSAIPDGPPVDYASTETNAEYYYKSDGNFFFVWVIIPHHNTRTIG